MTDSAENNRMTCGEYLNRQRSELMEISDLSAPGAVSKAEKCLSNIYAVSYQMNFERREPPSPHRGPAENETLDAQLVREMSDGLRNKAHAFQGIVEDPWRLSQAMSCARQGNGFPLIEMVNVAFLARTAKTEPAAEKQPVAQKQVSAGTDARIRSSQPAAPKPSERMPAGPAL